MRFTDKELDAVDEDIWAEVKTFATSCRNTGVSEWLARILTKVSDGWFTENEKMMTSREAVAEAFEEQLQEALEEGSVDPLSPFITNCRKWIAASDYQIWRVCDACRKESEMLMRKYLLEVASDDASYDVGWMLLTPIQKAFDEAVDSYKG